MPNIPAGDTSAKVVPGIQTFCEWLVRLAGRIATCVESAEMVVDHIATHGRIPVSAAEDIALTQDLQARGQADPGGATNSDAASAQMVRLGIPNVHYHQAGASFDWVSVIKDGINRGVASVYGFNQAHLTYDDWTGQWTNQGVYGHGVAIVGYDSGGAIVADPNTQQAADGNFVHYSWDRLLAAASGNPDIITPEASLATPLDGYFNQNGITWTLKSDPSISISGGELALFIQVNGVIGLPRAKMHYDLQGKYHDDRLAFRLYERAVMVYDPNHVKDSEPSLGDFYLGHIDDPDYGIASPPAPPTPVHTLYANGTAVVPPYALEYR